MNDKFKYTHEIPVLQSDIDKLARIICEFTGDNPRANDGKPKIDKNGNRYQPKVWHEYRNAAQEAIKFGSEEYMRQVRQDD